METHKLDTDKQIFFYEQDFYVLSNFSAFRINWKRHVFDTSEAVYHWEKFPDNPYYQGLVQSAASAHESFKFAERFKSFRRKDWDAVKVDIMRDILRAKVKQHEYVHRKLLATGERELIEDSWRDDFWGWGPNKDGQNMLGKLWMEIRAEIRKNELNEIVTSKEVIKSITTGSLDKVSLDCGNPSCPKCNTVPTSFTPVNNE